MNETKKSLEVSIAGYVSAWGKSMSDSEKKRLKASYDYIAEKAVKVYKEQEGK